MKDTRIRYKCFPKRFGQIKVRFRIVLIWMAFIATIIFVLSAYMYKSMYSNTVDTMHNTLSLTAAQTAANLRETFSLIYNDMLGIATTQGMRAWFADEDYFDPANPDYQQRKLSFEDELRYRMLFNNAWDMSFINALSVYSDDDWMTHIYFNQISLNCFANQQNAVLANALQAGLEESSFIRLPPSEDMPRFFHVLKFVNYGGSGDSLIFFAGSDERVIAKRCSEITNIPGAQLFVSVASDGTVFSSSQKEMLGATLPDEMRLLSEGKLHLVDYANETYVVLTQDIIADELVLTVTIPERYIKAQVKENVGPYFVIIVALGLILLLVGVVLSVRTTVFIQDVVTYLNQVRNKNYNVRMPAYPNQALNDLSMVFNSMAEELRALIHDTYEKQLLLKEMDLKFLQHQMNPHFLFNTLLTIQLKAKASGDDIAFQMVQCLSDLLRAGIYSDQSIEIPLSKELEYINAYLYLQKKRFEDKLKYVISIESDALLRCMIPKLSLEPLIENAVEHGMKNDVCVTIQIRADREDLNCMVIDNGVGFNVESFTKLQKESIKDYVWDGKIGMINTDRRLRLLYGQKYGLKVESVLDIGTTVQVRIPLRYGDEQDV